MIVPQIIVRKISNLEILSGWGINGVWSLVLEILYRKSAHYIFSSCVRYDRFFRYTANSKNTTQIFVFNYYFFFLTCIYLILMFYILIKFTLGSLKEYRLSQRVNLYVTFIDLFHFSSTMFRPLIFYSVFSRKFKIINVNVIYFNTYFLPF